MGTGSTSLGVKRLRCVADSSPLFSVEVNNACSDTATPPIILQGMYRDNFTFYILIIKERRCTNFSIFFFRIELYMFRTGLQSIIRSLVLYTQQKVYVIQVMLTAC